MEENITRAISELRLAISCIDTFKEEHNWRLLGFEIPLHNALNYLEQIK